MKYKIYTKTWQRPIAEFDNIAWARNFCQKQGKIWTNATFYIKNDKGITFEEIPPTKPTDYSKRRLSSDPKTYNDFKPFSKDQAYWERNQLVAALTKIFPAWTEDHPTDPNWDDDWRTIIFIEIPTEELTNKYVQGGFMVNKKRQLSWHIHDSDKIWFSHLPHKKGNSWDGHTTEEKYQRLSNIKIKKKWYHIL